MTQFKLIVFLSFFLGLTPLYLLAQTPDELKTKLATTTGEERLTVLHQLIVTYQHISIDSALFYSQQALVEAEVLANDSLLAKAHLRLCPFYLYKGELDSVFVHAEIAQKIGERINSLSTASSALQLMANAYYHQGKPEKAIEYNLLSLEGFQKMNHTVGIRVLRGNLANLYSETGDYDKSLFQALEFEKIAVETDHQSSKGRAALLLSNVYLKLDKKEKHKAYLYNAKSTYSLDSFPAQHANTLNFIANMHTEENRIDSALFYYSNALKINQDLGNLGNIADTEGNLGATYLEAKDWQKGYYHLQKSIQANKELDRKIGLAYNYFSLGQYFNFQNNKDSTIFYLSKSLTIAQESKVSTLEEKALLELVQFYEKYGQPQKALTYHKQYFEHINNTKGLETEKTIVALETKYETEKKEREIERLELQSIADASKNNTLKIGLLGSLLIFGLLIAGLLYRRKNEQKLYALKQKMHEQEKKELDKELSYKTKQLTSHALHMVQKNKVLQELKQGISEISKSSDTTNKKALRSLIRRIDFNIQSDEDWNTFKLYFEQTNQNFYKNLAKINSELTSTELKLCSLIKLNMNIKETASVLNIEPTSVKTARHRLRKKLNLQQGQDLTSFIRQVA